ncbi:hypothetical protein AAMO2058_001053500 [Amorphochlora amoebiformis]|uniref:Uncharacterized protein n=1 Tax=Amorphochlora amoebiformis TaxID=1561963 RepID=A0A6T6Y8Z0_9EUKA|mmetsp:Transcript_33865/g.54530  ORF Transcript_33865/g.54530 Transcript_33865/m.54530 type:complete len:219 (+) Transcript_33865:49-705(+)
MRDLYRALVNFAAMFAITLTGFSQRLRQPSVLTRTPGHLFEVCFYLRGGGRIKRARSPSRYTCDEDIGSRRNRTRQLVGSLDVIKQVYGNRYDVDKFKMDEHWLGRKGAYLNTYEAYKGDVEDSYGTLVSQLLANKTGSKFRNTKKRFKRNSVVRGGKISLTPRSIVYSSSQQPSESTEVESMATGEGWSFLNRSDITSESSDNSTFFKQYMNKINGM